ncbi:alkylation response protein AidB-like acyl-CoA dehydrogenase [Williamsia limnetica]|uniref:Alkylation response protein AidB-like acyl-CoA dehydrogenase n=1 Tax=Williamsia limnetica TaxID=882452 RepID=A0A318RGT6_WILLI|nr:acyl-CoA dehydrogenase family protein [Williamsia limnetica]PYE12443.1 alkylation response protein AidB-like acyl-CoA dehydrogenase [Williamsia limnetica]
MTTVINPAIPDLLYSETEESLREALVDALDRSNDWPVRLARSESEATVDSTLWRTLAADMGLAGLPIGEPEGGAGASWRESAVVMEELGRRVEAVPFLGSAITATALLDAVGGGDVLRQVAAGEMVAVLAVAADTPPWHRPHAVVRSDTGALVGRVPSVTDALIADLFLVVVSDELYAVPARSVSVTPVTSLDMTRQLADLHFDDAEGMLIASGPDVTLAAERALTLSVAMLASEQLGVAEACLTMAVEYLKERRQFGRVLGSYQALKHRLADLWVDITHARAAARHAAGCAADDNPDLPIASALAGIVCAEVALKAAQECIQLHGGIGFTWEHPAHLFLKRAKSSTLMFGGVDGRREHLGTLVGITSDAGWEGDSTP